MVQRVQSDGACWSRDLVLETSGKLCVLVWALQCLHTSIRATQVQTDFKDMDGNFNKLGSSSCGGLVHDRNHGEDDG